jgi:hypothetical protein
VILARRRRRKGRRPSRRSRIRFGGTGATIAITIAALLAVGTAGVVVALARRDPEAPTSEHGQKARSIAEAAISAKISKMVAGDYADLGASDRSVPIGGGSAWVAVENFDVRHGLFRLTAQATFAGETQVVEAILRPLADPAPPCAVFAGNASNDPGYVLAFGGEGGAADAVEGDVYSGRDLAVHGAARIAGRLLARGRIDGAEGDFPVTRGGPDFAAILRGRRPSEHARTFQVDAHFSAATLESDPWGGRAWQVSRENPAHVFRKNPSDREELCRTTPGDDYFLEDPCGSERSAAPDADGAAWIDVTGADGSASAPGVVFVIDGDLWITNRSLRAVRFGRPDGGRTSVAFIVRGDVHLGADVVDPKGRGDAIAFVALRREGREASGDIRIGGELANPVEHLDALLFAERDLRREAEPRRPSSLVVRGALVAGNQIVLGSEPPHARLVVEGGAGAAIAARAGLPVPPERVSAFTVLSWRALGAP